MSRRRLLAWLGVFASVGLAILGFLIFVIGVLAEFFANRDQPLSETISPTIQVALAGLGLAALMILLGFVLVFLLLIRQTRLRGSGYGDAYRLMEKLQFKQAIPLLEKSIAAGRESADILMLLTSAYAHTGQLAKAQAAADRAVQLYPDNPGAYITLANGYRLQASYQEAAAALRAATELAPEQAVIWAELAFVLRLAGDDTAALQAFERAASKPLPAMYGVRVYYHLVQAYRRAGKTDDVMAATAKMMSARAGLEAWKPIFDAIEGTAYGQTLHYEIANIERALAQADESNLG